MTNNENFRETVRAALNAAPGTICDFSDCDEQNDTDYRCIAPANHAGDHSLISENAVSAVEYGYAL